MKKQEELIDKLYGDDMGFIVKNLRTNKEIYVTTKAAMRYIDEFILKRIR